MDPQALLGFRRIVPQLLGTLRLAWAELRHDSVMPPATVAGKAEEVLIHSSRLVRAHPFAASQLFPSRKR
jgi:hypothetical protein